MSIKSVRQQGEQRYNQKTGNHEFYFMITCFHSALVNLSLSCFFILNKQLIPDDIHRLLNSDLMYENRIGSYHVGM